MPCEHNHGRWLNIIRVMLEHNHIRVHILAWRVQDVMVSYGNRKLACRRHWSNWLRQGGRSTRLADTVEERRRMIIRMEYRPSGDLIWPSVWINIHVNIGRYCMTCLRLPTGSRSIFQVPQARCTKMSSRGPCA